MGNSEWLNRRVELYPLAADFVLAYNFFDKFLDVGGLSAFRDFVSIGTYPTQKSSTYFFIVATGFSVTDNDFASRCRSWIIQGNR